MTRERAAVKAMKATKPKAATKTKAAKVAKARPAPRTVCVHRNAAGKYDCNLPRNLSKSGKPSGRMCTKHEAAWRAAAKERYLAAHPAQPKAARTPSSADLGSKVKAAKKVARNSGGQKRTTTPTTRPMGTGPVARASAPGAVASLVS
jgi:hypothetical protein